MSYIESKGFIIPDNIPADPINMSPLTEYLANIITNSQSPFTIGIYGDWGTGKTTIMQYVENTLKQKMNQDLKSKKKLTIIPVWFNAWRYEKENQLALIPLLKTIEYAIPEAEYKGLRNALREAGLFSLDIASEIIPSIISSNFGDKIGNIFHIGFKNLNDKLRQVDENVIKNTIYFEGIKKIEKQIEEIQDIKIVIFIDDLDRCSQDKTLEVFESMKAFFDIKGFIYIIGISFEKISELMSAVYRNTNFSGDQYLEKIIQFHVSIPEWTESNLIQLIQKLSDNEIRNKKYKKSLNDNAELISLCVKKNPRILKKFLNNLIYTLESYSLSSTEISQVIVLQILYTKWYNYYTYIIERGTEIIEIICNKRFHKEKSELSIKDNGFKNIINKDLDFIQFFEKYKDIFESISNWDTHSKFIKSLNEKQISDFEGFIQLLKKGKIKEFNEKRKIHDSLDFIAVELPNLDLRNVDFSFMNLSGANLSDSDLRASSIRYTNLSNARLYRADLSNSDLYRSDLTDTKMSGANLTKSILSYAKSESKLIINECDLSGTNLSYSYLRDAFLNKSDLSNSILRHFTLYYSKATNAIFTNADISYSNMLECDFSNSNFIDSNLSHSSITKSTFSNVKFSNANLSYSDFNDSTFDDIIGNNFKCEGTDFLNAVTNNQAFFSFLRKNNPKTLPSFKS